MNNITEMNTSITGMMDAQPNSVVGQENPSKYEKQGTKRQKKAQLNYRYMKIRNKKGNEMKAIVEVLLEKGINEDTIHDILDVIEGVDIPDFVKDAQRKRENVESFHKMKAEQGAREKAQQEKDKKEVEAAQYQAKAMRGLQDSIKGKKARTPMVESVLEYLEDILSEGRKEGESQEQFTKRLAGEMYPKIKAKMATQKSIRRNAEKVEKGAKKEIKQIDKDWEQARKDYKAKSDKYLKALKDQGTAGDVYRATFDAHGYDHPATNKASKDYDKVEKKTKKAEKESDKARIKVDDLHNKGGEIRAKKWNAYDKKHEAQRKVEDLSGKATRADHRRDPFA